jgi:hypothetical protein
MVDVVSVLTFVSMDVKENLEVVPVFKFENGL